MRIPPSPLPAPAALPTPAPAARSQPDRPDPPRAAFREQEKAKAIEAAARKAARTIREGGDEAAPEAEGGEAAEDQDAGANGEGGAED